jgi:hypothetical protein
MPDLKAHAQKPSGKSVKRWLKGKHCAGDIKTTKSCLSGNTSTSENQI